MHLIPILLSIWYLIGLVTGIVATYMDWREGYDVRAYHIPLTLLSGLFGPCLTWILWCDKLPDIGDWVLIPGRRKP